MGTITFPAGVDRPAMSGESIRREVSQTTVDDFMRQVLSTQETMRAPELFAMPHVSWWRRFLPGLRQATRHGDLASRGATIFRRLRQDEPTGSGLITVALRHGSLPRSQQRAIGLFRLHQYALCGWYDPSVILRRRLEVDPTTIALDDDAIHVVVGAPDGKLLAYFCMEPATHQRTAVQDNGWLARLDGVGRQVRQNVRSLNFPQRRHDSIVQPLIADPERALFSTERDLFGARVFTTLPRLAQTSISQVRELSCLLRNQAVGSSSRLGLIAVVEAISAMAQLIMDPSLKLQAVVGHVDQEARQLTAELGMPVLYAPLAPIAPHEQDWLWASSVDNQGRFWPFVIASEDLHANADAFVQLDESLNGSVTSILRDLIAHRRNPRHLIPPEAMLSQSLDMTSHERALVSKQQSADMLWTSDAFFETAREAPIPVLQPVMKAISA